MSELKITTSHLRRAAVVYVRQSTLAQVERNTESTARQYDLVTRAAKLGWPRSAVRVIDDDLGLSGASTTGRSGFAELAAQVGLGQVGIVLSLECSRLARNNADWYRLLDLAGRAPCPRPSCTSCGPASTAESATRQPAANCAAGCRSGWSGARPTVRSAGIPTRPSPG